MIWTMSSGGNDLTVDAESFEENSTRARVFFCYVNVRRDRGVGVGIDR
jgi:hypothetical protein